MRVRHRTPVLRRMRGHRPMQGHRRMLVHRRMQGHPRRPVRQQHRVRRPTRTPVLRQMQGRRPTPGRRPTARHRRMQARRRMHPPMRVHLRTPERGRTALRLLQVRPRIPHQAADRRPTPARLRMRGPMAGGAQTGRAAPMARAAQMGRASPLRAVGRPSLRPAQATPTEGQPRSMRSFSIKVRSTLLRAARPRSSPPRPLRRRKPR